jgi:FAD/FMN-containing dehydrogenase
MDDVRGPILLRGEPGYEEARLARVFNALRPERYPAAVLQAESAADVAAAVRFAGARGWRVSVRSGGHSWPVWSLRDETLLIDLGRMREIDLDPATGVASVQPAATGRELVPFLAERGLMFQSGHAPDVGLGGYLLQGGAGWNTRGWGWACRQLRAIELVTADGRLLRADADQNQDLLWAARGAGHGFPAIATRFELETRPLPGALLETSYVLPISSFEQAFGWLLGERSAFARIVEFGLVGARDAAGDSVIVLFALALGETEAEAEAALEPFSRCPAAKLAMQSVVAQPTSFEEQYDRIAARNSSALRYAVDSAWIDASDDETVTALRRAFVELPTPHSEALWMSLGGGEDLPDMALSLQTDSYLAVFAKWENDREDETSHRWLGDLMRELEPISRGVFLGDCDLARRDAPFMSAENRRRLEEIRARRDPDGLFCSFMTAAELGVTPA